MHTRSLTLPLSLFLVITQHTHGHKYTKHTLTFFKTHTPSLFWNETHTHTHKVREGEREGETIHSHVLVLCLSLTHMCTKTPIHFFRFVLQHCLFIYYAECWVSFEAAKQSSLSLNWGQFHQQFTSSFCANNLAPKTYKAKQPAQKIFGAWLSARKLLVKCWWNWPLSTS